MLEAMLHGPVNSFITLTYSDDALPRTPNGMPTLHKEDLQNFLKRFRKSIEPMRIRFYGVGEYGDETFRPHYHLAVFGYPPCARGRTRQSGNNERCCDVCDRVLRAWERRGRIEVATLDVGSAAYIAGYVTKKLTDARDPRLNGRDPEFCRMSNRPGLGKKALVEIAKAIPPELLLDSEADVPSALRHGNKLYPLGRYLVRELRTMLWGCPDALPSTLAIPQAYLSPLYEAARSLPTPEARAVAYKTLILEAADQAVLNMQARHAIFKQKRHL